MAGMVLAVATVIVLIVDLDRPNTGSIGVSQKTLLDLYNSMGGGR